MDYQAMKARVFARGTIPDGHFGAVRRVDFAFNESNGRTYVVADIGCFAYQTPPAVDRAEALWLLQHHPVSNATRVKVATK